MGDRFALRTPENVRFEYEIAGVGSRFIAALLDTLLLGALLLGLVLVLLIVNYLAGVEGAGFATAVQGAITIAALISINLILFGYYVFFELAWNGQSPGKRRQRLRVIKASGYPVTLLDSLARNFVRIVDFLPGFYAIGMVTMLANKKACRLGDFVAGTMVVKEGTAATLSDLRRAALANLAQAGPPGTPLPGGTRPGGQKPWTPVSLPAATGLSGGPAALPPPPATRALPDRLTERDMALIREYLDRRWDVDEARRRTLARQIAAAILPRLDRPQASGEDPERLLEALLAEYERSR